MIFGSGRLRILDRLGRQCYAGHMSAWESPSGFRHRAWRAAFLSAVLAAPAFGVRRADAGDWALTPFAGLGTDGGIQHIPLLDADFVRSYLAGLGIARTLWTPVDPLSVEAEVQAVQHFGKQDNAEFNAMLALRWSRFPWSNHVHTSLAVAEGVSYATHIPAIERKRGKVHSHLLNYIYYELEVGPARPSAWSLIKRIHHRSGVQGLYGGASRGSNFVAAGLRYRR